MSRSSNPFQPPATSGRPVRSRRPRKARRSLAGRLFQGGGALVVGIGTFIVIMLLMAPSTPEPGRIIGQPDANSASLKDSERASLFEKFTYLQPASKVWGTGTSGESWTMTYRDVTGCNADEAKCPEVTFVDLSNADARSYFNNNPLDWWAEKASCQKSGEHILEGSEEFDTDGETTRYYRIPCGDEGVDTAHAWYIPGKDLFVFTLKGEAGSFSVEILKTVMDSVRWK